MIKLQESPSQTAGPYVHIGCSPASAGCLVQRKFRPLGDLMISGEPDGERITLEIGIADGAGAAVEDALVEIWQPGPEGGFGETRGFSNWGRQAVDFQTGLAIFETLMPGSRGTAAPHILVWIAARGINLALTTRIYFPHLDNSTDPVFLLAADRAPTMIARPTDSGYFHTIRLQGDQETVFLDA